MKRFCNAKASHVLKKNPCIWLLSRKPLNELASKRARQVNDAFNNRALEFVRKKWLTFVHVHLRVILVTGTLIIMCWDSND